MRPPPSGRPITTATLGSLLTTWPAMASSSASLASAVYDDENFTVATRGLSSVRSRSAMGRP